MTWEVRGKNLDLLSDQLKNKKGIEQVAPFGTTLHISGRDPALIAESITPSLKDPNYQWHEIRPTLEDIFISLSTIAQEKRYV